MHVGITCKPVQVVLGIVKLHDIGHTFKKYCICLQEPCPRQNMIKTMNPHIVESHVVSLDEVPLAWKPTSHLQEVIFLESMDLFEKIHVCQVSLEDWSAEVSSQSNTS